MTKDDLSDILLVKNSAINIIRTAGELMSDSSNFTNYVLLVKSMSSLSLLTLFGLQK